MDTVQRFQENYLVKHGNQSVGAPVRFLRTVLWFLLFLTFSVLVANPNYFTRWPFPLVVCWTGEKKRKKKTLAAPPHPTPRAALSEKIK